MIKDRFAAIIFGTLILLTILLLAVIVFNQRNFYRLSDSQEIVRLQIAGKNFHIPKSYMRDSTAWSGGIHDGVNLHAHLPDMGGYTKDHADEFERAGSDKILALSLQKKSGIFSAERSFNIYKEKYMTGEPVPTSFDLVRSDLGGYQDDKELYYPSSGTLPAFFILCGEQGSDINPVCSYYIEYQEDMVINVTFSRKILPDWKLIKEKVTRLIDSFQHPG